MPSATSVKQRKSSSSSVGSCRKKEKLTVNQSSLALSPTETHQIQSESADTHSQNGNQLDESKSGEGSQVDPKKCRNRKKRRKSGK